MSADICRQSVQLVLRRIGSHITSHTCKPICTDSVVNVVLGSVVPLLVSDAPVKSASDVSDVNDATDAPAQPGPTQRWPSTPVSPLTAYQLNRDDNLS